MLNDNPEFISSCHAKGGYFFQWRVSSQYIHNNNSCCWEDKAFLGLGILLRSQTYTKVIITYGRWGRGSNSLSVHHDQWERIPCEGYHLQSHSRFVHENTWHTSLQKLRRKKFLGHWWHNKNCIKFFWKHPVTLFYLTCPPLIFYLRYGQSLKK